MNGRLIAIGDIHGCHFEFAELLARLAPGRDDRLILLGDLVNRGPDSSRVIELARAQRALALLGIDTGCVLGGHLTAYELPEKRFLQVKARQRSGPNRPFLCQPQPNRRRSDSMPDELPVLIVRELKALDPAASGRAFASVLVVKKLATKTASNGNTFLSVELGDRTGSFGCTVFGDSPGFETLKAAGEGGVVRIEGRIEFYQGRLSPRLSRATALAEAELGAPGVLESLVEIAPENHEAMWTEFAALIDSIGHAELRQTVRGVFDDIGETFRWSPAAVAMHHAYRHGLLEHTLHMARACRALLPLYPEVDADLALAGILLHDTGKAIEYEGTLATKRSRRGILQGHVVLGYQLTRKAAIRARLDADHLERLEHIILSHQGEPEWGAAVYAATPEAVFVSMIDNLDARMGMVQRALRQAGELDEFSERLPGLSSPLLTRKLPPPPPQLPPA